MSTCEMIIQEISISDISVNPHQPRRHFSEEDIQELAGSIQKVGLIHPPLVRPLDMEGKYELISGERRFRAAQSIGMIKIPVIIRNTTDHLSAEQALVENIQRVDLNPIEIAKALKSLTEIFNLTQEELAERIGKKRSSLANYLRLLTLPKIIQEGISLSEISMGHAKAILSLQNLDQQIFLYELIIRDALSVREAEKKAQGMGKKAEKKKLVYVDRNFYLEQLAEKVQHRLGTKVNIIGKGKKGRIFIDYYNFDDLDRVLSILGIDGL